MSSIRWHLTRLLCTAIATLFITSGTCVFLTMRHWILSGFDETLTAKARALITASEIDDKKFEIDLIVHEFAGFGANGSDFFEIRRLDGTVFLQSLSLTDSHTETGGIGNAPPPPDDTPILTHSTLGNGTPVRKYLARFYPKGDKKGQHQDLYLVVASPVAATQRQLTLLAATLATTGTLALLILIPLVRSTLTRGLHPLKELTHNLAAIQPENLHQRLNPPSYPAELQPVASQLNSWLAQLQQSFERERRFSSHAAHELRTPIAELRTMAELAAMFPEEGTKDHFTQMAAATEHLSSLLEKLFLLGRADADRIQSSPTPLRLQDTTRSALARITHTATQRNLHILANIPPLTLHTDPQLWDTILQNLLDNAVSHAPEHTEIHLRADTSGLTVSNPAPSLSTDDIPHLFDPFWRKEGPRADSRHSGLGLALVQACTRTLHWQCHANLTPTHWLEIHLQWPPSTTQTN